MQVFGHLEVSEDAALIARSIANILTTPTLVVEMCIGTGIMWDPPNTSQVRGVFTVVWKDVIEMSHLLTYWMRWIARSHMYIHKLH